MSDKTRTFYTLEGGIKKRQSDIEEFIKQTTINLEQAKIVGGHSCYACGYEAGYLESLHEELLALNKILHDASVCARINKFKFCSSYAEIS